MTAYCIVFFLGTVSYTINQMVLGYEYFGVQSNGDFYVKNGLTTFSSGNTLTVSATAADTGGLTGSQKNYFCFIFYYLFKNGNVYQWMVFVNFILPFFLENLLLINSFNILLPYVNILMTCSFHEFKSNLWKIVFMVHIILIGFSLHVNIKSCEWKKKYHKFILPEQ